MTHREVAEQALNHKEGKVPVDFGGSTNTGIHCRPVGKLRDYYGLENRPVKVIEPYQMLGSIDDDLKDVLESDTTPLERWLLRCLTAWIRRERFRLAHSMTLSMRSNGRLRPRLMVAGIF